jgi:DNA topoisomerase-1
MAGMKTLIIVESPHKAKAVAALARPAISGTVFAWACLGHLRDLPADEFGVDIEGKFDAEYIIPKNRQKTVASLREKIAQADTVLLATDPDREGEAVAWHVTQVFAPELSGKTVQRVAFNAITASTIQESIRHPRELDMPQVMAAVARRVLDRLVGWHVSPVLWGTMKGEKVLSAGRVQTAALRLLVEHEREQAEREQVVTWEVQVEL